MSVRRAKKVLQEHQTSLIEAIVAADLNTIVNSCEEKGLITHAVKDKLVSDYTHESAADRASKLVDSIRKSLAFDPDTVLRKLLLILNSKGGLGGKGISEKIAKECKRVQF